MARMPPVGSPAESLTLASIYERHVTEIRREQPDARRMDASRLDAEVAVRMAVKVCWLQNGTAKINEALQALAPDRQLNSDYRQIISEGTGKRWTADHNQRWLKETRPILEAFFHARYMLEMAVSYGKELERPPSVLPSGWAALLCLFDLR